MKTKTFAIALVCVFSIACASIEVPGREAEFYKLFNNISFDEIWNASLKALDDLGLIIGDKNKEKGYIYAKKREDHPIGTPAMEIFIREENGEIKVACEPLLASPYRGPEALREDRKWAELFFSSLDKKLNL